MSVVEQLDGLGAHLLAGLVDRSFGDITVAEGFTDVRYDSDDQISLFVTLVLSEPSGDAGWDADDVKAIRSSFRELVIDQRTELTPYLRFISTGDARELRQPPTPEV